MKKLLPLVALSAAALAGQSPVFPAARLVDLTHPFDGQTIYWPTAQPFRYEKEHWGVGPGGYFYAAGRYSASEHGGTHLDAPIHFAEGKAAVDEIPLADLFLPAVVVDVSARAQGNPDYRVQPSDLAAWERAHGRIPAGSAVLVRTGWGRYWPDRARYLGTAKPGDVAGLRFPGIGVEPPRCWPRAAYARWASIPPASTMGARGISSPTAHSTRRTSTDWRISPTWKNCRPAAPPSSRCR
jgi:kynurenine formamidase